MSVSVGTVCADIREYVCPVFGALANVLAGGSGGPRPHTPFPLPRAGPRGDLGGGVSGPSMGVQGRGALLSARIVPGGAVGVSVG